MCNRKKSTKRQNYFSWSVLSALGPLIPSLSLAGTLHESLQMPLKYYRAAVFPPASTLQYFSPRLATCWHKIILLSPTKALPSSHLLIQLADSIRFISRLHPHLWGKACSSHLKWLGGLSIQLTFWKSGCSAILPVGVSMCLIYLSTQSSFFITFCNFISLSRQCCLEILTWETTLMFKLGRGSVCVCVCTPLISHRANHSAKREQV